MNGMNTIFSREWFSEFVDRINSSPEYESAAKTWEGDIMFVIRGDNESVSIRAGNEVCVRLDLYHGKCRDMSFLSSGDGPKTDYSLDGSASVWESVIRGETDLISSVMNGKIRLSGNTMKLMRYLKAAEELIISARSVTRL